jgi:spectinomycin phosphotransferase
MLVKPDIQDEDVILCLQAGYGLQIQRVTFLPLGGDLSTAVYRADAEDETAYFCKLKFGDFDEISVALPKYLSEQGIAQIIAPLATIAGQLWAHFGKMHLVLYPFVVGTSGFEMELTERHWADFSLALNRIHTMPLPPALARNTQTDRFSAEWRERCRQILQRLENETFDDLIMVECAAYLQARRATILALIGRAERLAGLLTSRSIEFVLCHADIHPGNLFIDTRGDLFIVDWDYPILAPKECDLMFIGSGQGYVGRTAQEEEALFYRNYDSATIDPIALAYYRCERSIVDIVVECKRIFSPMLNDQERAQSRQIITWLFMPDGSIEIAYRSDPVA